VSEELIQTGTKKNLCWILFSLNKSIFHLVHRCSRIEQLSVHADTLRYVAIRYWDSGGTNIKTQTKLGWIEFRFLSQLEGVTGNEFLQRDLEV